MVRNHSLHDEEDDNCSCRLYSHASSSQKSDNWRFTYSELRNMCLSKILPGFKEPRSDRALDATMLRALIKVIAFRGQLCSSPIDNTVH
jgi:hypothetical protein